MSTDIQPEVADVTAQGDTDTVEVRRDGPLSAVVAATAAVVAVAYLLRALGGGGALDWLLFLVVGAVAATHLAGVVDSRAPLMVLDRHGVRVRRGRHWQGVAWPEVTQVEHRPRTSLLHDGRLDVVDAGGRVIGVRLCLSTRLIGANWHELTAALEDLTEGRTEVREVAPEPPAPPVTTVTTGPVEDPAAASEVATTVEADVEPVVEPVVEPFPMDIEPVRPPVAGRRSDVRFDRPVDAEITQNLAAVLPHAVAPSAETTTIVIDAGDLPLAAEVVSDPVVGPVLAAARARLGLSVDQLADRTRIRPHVIEAIEADDFAPCGGDFYARGHLRILARVLGVDAGPLLADYDERYADAPLDPRRVFEAELATGAGAPIRGTRGGLNWSVLVAAVMAVVMVWSIARLVMDHPAPVSQHIVLNGSPGGKASLTSGHEKAVPVEVTAATGGARVIVRDSNGKVVFDNQLAFMQTADVQVVPPVRISSSDGGLTVSVAGTDKGAIGSTGQDAQQTYVP